MLHTVSTLVNLEPSCSGKWHDEVACKSNQHASLCRGPVFLRYDLYGSTCRAVARGFTFDNRRGVGQRALRVSGKKIAYEFFAGRCKNCGVSRSLTKRTRTARPPNLRRVCAF